LFEIHIPISGIEYRQVSFMTGAQQEKACAQTGGNGRENRGLFHMLSVWFNG